jgi:hypothetical protein
MRETCFAEPVQNDSGAGDAVRSVGHFVASKHQNPVLKLFRATIAAASKGHPIIRTDKPDEQQPPAKQPQLALY